MGHTYRKNTSLLAALLIPADFIFSQIISGLPESLFLHLVLVVEKIAIALFLSYRFFHDIHVRRKREKEQGKDPAFLTGEETLGIAILLAVFLFFAVIYINVRTV